MRRIKELQNLVTSIKNQKFDEWIEDLTFTRIFLAWTAIIIIFGIIYFLTANGFAMLTYNSTQEKVTSIGDAIYFSFVAATSSGFGGITPAGAFKIVATVQVVLGLLLLALVTSKIIAIKQNVILSEVYEISFNERINKLRSSFLLFRQDLTRIINKLEEDTLHRREVNEINVYFTPFEDALSETFFLFQRATKSSFVKSVDPLNTELILHSIIHSLQKITEFMDVVKEKHMEDKVIETLALLDRCMLITDKVFENMKQSSEVEEEKLQDIITQKNEVFAQIYRDLEKIKKGNLYHKKA